MCTESVQGHTYSFVVPNGTPVLHSPLKAKLQVAIGDDLLLQMLKNSGSICITKTCIQAMHHIVVCFGNFCASLHKGHDLLERALYWGVI